MIPVRAFYLLMTINVKLFIRHIKINKIKILLGVYLSAYIDIGVKESQCSIE